MRQVTTLFYACIFALCIADFATAPARAQAIDKTLVVVNEEAVTLSEYLARHRQEALQNARQVRAFDGEIDARILEAMIDDRIQAQMAVRQGIRVSPQEVERAMESIAARNGLSMQELFGQLASGGVAPDEFRGTLYEQQLIRKLAEQAVNARVTVSDEEVENYLASHPDPAGEDDAFEFSRLVVSLRDKTAEQEAADLENLAHIRQGVLDGRSFAKSAEEFSDAEDRDGGGYVGWQRASELPQAIVDALRKTETGGMSEIIRGDENLYLLQLHDRVQERQMFMQQKLRHILLLSDGSLDADELRERAEELHARIVDGEDFATIARAHSADQISGSEGGDLGWVNPGEFPPEIERELIAMEIGELSRPLFAGGGYHLLQVVERRETEVREEEAALRAREIIFQRKAGAFYDNWYGALRASAHIEYLIPQPSAEQ